MCFLLPATVLSLLSIFPSAGSQGQVHVVDAAGGPGSDFTAIFAAVAAAADGDVVLARAGDYDPDPFTGSSDGVSLSGKGLTVVAEAGAAVRMSALQIENLPAGRFALLQGLTATPPLFTQLNQNSGPLWFENCRFEPVLAGRASGGMREDDCDTVVLSRCLASSIPLLLPNFALSASGSRLHVFDSQVEAGPENSMAFILDTGSFLELSGSSVLGGDGADGSSLTFDCNGQDGGDALVVRGASHALILDSILEGGTGGAPFASSCSRGADGQDLVVQSGSATLLTGKARSLQASSPLRENGVLQAQFSGKPGDRVWIRYSARPGPGIASPQWDGELLLGSPRFGFFIGTIPASGTLLFQVGAPDLAPGVESAVFFCQGFFRDVDTGRFVASSPSAVVVLDESF